ncbi:DUF790 family protein [Candidatus Magnetaquicoccus inordinatus]|uniref:DUF790 family protein n=1 Tax=Candidatus Magnetaquicoccus inordinatus TaxID=2496818 RepID=UPI00102AF1E0|nr:DUF790 family protein [Candidatus Magnetaquicoccus inordinatus]
MLTRDLLRFDIRRERVYPRYLDVQDRSWQEVARALNDTFEAAVGSSREELQEACLPIIHGARSPLVTKGLCKLLLDRCQFQEGSGEWAARRLQVFQTAAALFYSAAEQEAGSNDLQHYRQMVGQRMQEDADQLAARLYADLPDRQQLLSFAGLQAEALLQRYNLALAQGPLLWAKSMQLHMEEKDVGVRRRFFRQLKFFRLLVRLQRPTAESYRLHLDGPLSLFEGSGRYGVLLASFLPVICLLSRWQLTADIEFPARMSEHASRGKKGSGAVLLELDHGSGLHTHLQQTADIVPEELSRFATLFAEQVSAWKIAESSDLLELQRQEWVIPDWSFQHQSGQVVHLELFHRWHAQILRRRLHSLVQGKSALPALAIGVDRALSKQADMAELLEKSDWFQRHGFVYHQIPPLKRVVEALQSFLPETNEMLTAER